MRLRSDRRGQSVQIGAAILLAFVVLTISLYQAQVVPAQNSQVEFNHNQLVQGQMQDVRNAVVSITGGGSDRSVSVKLGTSFPERTIFVNPPAPSGQLRTTGPGPVRIENASADGEVGDFWTGETRSYTTRGLLYVPSYTEYDRAPVTVYENTVVYDVSDTATIVDSSQRLVDGREITLGTLNGSYQEASTRTVSVDLRGTSTSERVVTVSNATDPVTVTVPTRLSEAKWRELLDREFVPAKGGNGHVVGISTTAVPDEPYDLLHVRLEAGVEYSLRMAKVGVGSGVTQTGPAYIDEVSGDGATIRTGSDVALVAEVRDEFNNPYPGQVVNATVVSGPGTVRPPNDTSDADGRVDFRYSSSTPGTATVQVSFGSDPNSSQARHVNYTVTVQPSGVTGPTYNTNWEDPDKSNPSGPLTGCTPNSCTFDAGADPDGVLDLVASSSPPTSGEPASFSVSDSSVATVSPSSNTTDGSGDVGTTLVPRANGTVDVTVTSGGSSDTIRIQVQNVTSTDSTPPTIASATAVDLTDRDGVVGDGDTVEVRADVSDGGSGVDTVTADASRFGGSSVVSLTDGDGDGVYDGTFTVDESAASLDGDYPIEVTATDNEGNRQTANTNQLTLDTTAPSISNFQASNPSGSTLQVSFDSDESLSNVSVPVTNSTGDTVATFDETEFAESCSGGTCTYTASTTLPDGTYEATLATAEDDAGNDGATGQNDSATIATGGPTVTNPTATDRTNGDGVVGDGDTVRVNATVTDPDGVSSVTADASAFGGPASLNLTDGDGDDVYDATFTVDAATASADGNYSMTVTATDGAGDTTSADTNELTLDTSDPTVTSATVAGAPINDSDTGTARTVTVTFDEAMDTSVDPTVEITGMAASPYAVSGSWANDTTWTGSVTLADDDENVTGTISVAGARDTAGNLQSPDPDNSNTFLVDTENPRITDFAATSPTVGDLQVSFNASERVSNVQVPVDDSTGTTVATLTDANFTETANGDGTYRYVGTYTVASDDTYTATLTAAEDPVGNPTPDSPSDSTTVTAACGPSDPGVVDDFEDGDLSEYTYTFNPGDLQNFDTTTSPTSTGSSTFSLDSDNDGGGGDKGIESDCLANAPRQGDTFTYDIYFAATSGGSAIEGFEVTFGVTDDGDNYRAQVDRTSPGTSGNQYAVEVGNGNTATRSSSFAMNSGEWYEAEVAWGSDTVTFTFFAPDGTELASVTVATNGDEGTHLGFVNQGGSVFVDGVELK